MTTISIKTATVAIKYCPALYILLCFMCIRYFGW